MRRVGPHSDIEKRLARKIPIKQQKSIPRLLYGHLLKNKFASHFVLQKQQQKKMSQELVVIVMTEGLHIRKVQHLPHFPMMSTQWLKQFFTFQTTSQTKRLEAQFGSQNRRENAWGVTEGGFYGCQWRLKLTLMKRIEKMNVRFSTCAKWL